MDIHLIARRLRGKKAHGDQITIENFAIDKIIIIIIMMMMMMMIMTMIMIMILVMVMIIIMIMITIMIMIIIRLDLYSAKITVYNYIL